MRLAIIGSGPGGYVAALKAAHLGAQVTVIEKEKAGGTCVNWGCIPTKALLASAEVLHKARNLSDYGIDSLGEATPNLPKMMERKEKIVGIQVKGILSLLKASRVDLISGTASLLSPQAIEVRAADGALRTVEADKIIIATGSRPAELPAFRFDGRAVLASYDILSIQSIPKSLIIIGAGVIGCEFACLFRELGSEVTILEVLPRALPTEDAEIAEIFERELRKKKITLLTKMTVLRSEVLPDGVHVFCKDGREVVGEKLLVSVGRIFNTTGIGLETVGVRTTAKGAIEVNSRMQTNVPGIYAVGDVTGGMLLAHVASREGVVAACNACGVPQEMDYAVVPSGIFTMPEIGSVGLREHQAAERGIKVRTGRFLFRALGRAHAIGEIAGVIKVVADAGSDRVLGVHIIGASASELVHEGALAIRAGLTTKDLADMIFAHPTLSEVFAEAAEDVHGEALHQPRR